MPPFQKKSRHFFIHFKRGSVGTLVYITSTFNTEWSQSLSGHLAPELQSQSRPLHRAIQITSELFISFHVQQTAAKHISWTTDLSEHNASLPELCPQRKMRTVWRWGWLEDLTLIPSWCTHGGGNRYQVPSVNSQQTPICLWKMKNGQC